MNKLTTLGLCSALLATAACTPMPDSRYDNHYPGETRSYYDSSDGYHDKAARMFDLIDTNNDGYISVGESNMFTKKKFVESDLNGDNRISRAEFAEHKHRVHGDYGYQKGTSNPTLRNRHGELLHGYNEPYNERNNSYKGDQNQYSGPYGSDLYYNDQYNRWERR